LLTIASLGLSLGDLKVIWRRDGRPGRRTLAWIWRRLAGLFERSRRPSPVRREPTLDMPARPSSAPDHIAAWRPGPSFSRRVRATTGTPFTAEEGMRFSEPAGEGEPDALADTDCHDMARRFAPEPPEPDELPGPSIAKFRLRRAPIPGPIAREDPQSAAEPGRKKGRSAGSIYRFSPFRKAWAPPKAAARQKPIWPGSVPAPPEDPLPEGQYRRPPADALYSRAVAIVRADRKASTEYLQQRLGIRYMRAADLIERMEQEGILGAPVRNGTRPILRRMPRTRIV
jgi:hypothetical protein